MPDKSCCQERRERRLGVQVFGHALRCGCIAAWWCVGETLSCIQQGAHNYFTTCDIYVSWMVCVISCDSGLVNGF